MHTRSSTIHAHPSFIDQGIAHVRDVVMPTLADMDGCVGMSMLVDRDGGQCILTSSWRDDDALRASEGRAAALRAQTLELFRGTVEIARWEIATLRRARSADRRAAVRATWLRCEPTRLERLIDTYKLALMPKIEELDGYCSASLMVDSATGQVVSSVGFDDRAAMLASRGGEQAVWAEAINETDAAVFEVREFDLAIAHLNAPEVA